MSGGRRVQTPSASGRPEPVPQERLPSLAAGFALKRYQSGSHSALWLRMKASRER